MASCTYASTGGGPLAVLVALICLPVGALVGGIGGAINTESSDEIAEARSRLQSDLKTLALQKRLREAMELYGRDIGLVLPSLPDDAGPLNPESPPDYIKLSNDFDTVIEVVALELLAKTSGAKRLPTSLQLKGRARVVDTHDGSLVDSFEVESTAIAHFADEWLADGGKPVEAGIRAVLREVAEDVIDEVLLIYHPPRSAIGPTTECSNLIPCYALRPVDPPARHEVYWFNPTWGHLERYKLSSLEPSFEWEESPRGVSISHKGAVYDFRIYRGSEIAYERVGLQEPRLQLETPLLPCQTYRWTVRSRFQLNGAPRATEWTGAFNTLGGEVAPWWFRRENKPALLLSPGNTGIVYYPIIKTPKNPRGSCKDQTDDARR